MTFNDYRYIYIFCFQQETYYSVVLINHYNVTNSTQVFPQSHIFSSETSEWVSEWVIVALCQFSNFSAISWREQVNFQWDDDEVRFVLNQLAELDLYSASSLKQQFADRHVSQLGHIILIPSQPVFALFSLMLRV